MSDKAPAQLTVQQTWIAGTAASINKFLDMPDAVTIDGYVLNFSDDVPPEKLFDISVKLFHMDKHLIFRRAVMRYNIGRLILEICARTKQTEDQVIIDCGLCERTGLSVKTLCNWAGVCSRLPHHFLKPGVSWTTLATMGDCRLPDDPKKLLELRKEQERILDLAAAKPHEYSSQDVKRELKECLIKLGMKDEDPGPSPSAIILEYAILMRKLRFMEESGLDDYSAIGFGSRAEIVNAIADRENSLINMEILSATVDANQ